MYSQMIALFAHSQHIHAWEARGSHNYASPTFSTFASVNVRAFFACEVLGPTIDEHPFDEDEATSDELAVDEHEATSSIVHGCRFDGRGACVGTGGGAKENAHCL